ncbi:hypothetical protein L218DRAFT_966874 [Marasmius fiardii PR-910]|nr:hypothetical protein L218DRAFT_966874 [Marasmius fiardii PR-910]
MEGIISNLLDSTLLECSGSHPSLFSTFDTISMILKKFVNRINVQPPIHSQHHLFKLLSWCKSYPQTYDHSKTLLRQQILDLFDHHPNEVYFSWLSKHLPPSWPLPPPPPFVPVPLHLPALANPASVPISAPVPTTVAYTSSGRQLPSLPATLRQFPPSTSTQRKGDFTWCELQTEQRKVLVAA